MLDLQPAASVLEKFDLERVWQHKDFPPLKDLAR